jgi:peroxiredoxin
MNYFLLSTITLALLATLAGGWLGWQLLHQNGRLLLRLDELEQRLNELEFGEGEEPAGLPVGSDAPAIELPDLAGESRSLAQHRGQRVLLLFFNPACGFCRELAPKLKEKAENRKQKPEIMAESGAVGDGGRSGKPSVLIITTGEPEANRALFDEHKINCPVLIQNDTEVAAAYQANGTPSGYLIDSEGRIASPLAIGADALLTLADGKIEKSEQDRPREQRTAVGKAGSYGHDTDGGRADRFRSPSLARSKIKRDGLKRGATAPEFRLPRLDGCGELALSDLRGRRILLVFSSPACGPCLELAPQLEKFHREHPELKVVMISKGEPKENHAKVKEHGLTFPVLLQRQWEISRRYAMFATPIAFLIDEAGIIRRDVAVGTDGVLALLAETGRWLEEHALAIT